MPLRVSPLASPAWQAPVAAPDGLGYLDALIAQLSRSGKPWAVGLDIDDTLMDTRGRTLASLRAFLRSAGQELVPRKLRERLKTLSVDDIGRDAATTLASLGAPRALVDAAQRFWWRFFWAPENLRHDVPMQRMIAIAKAVVAAGGQVVYITGRDSRLAAATRAQLIRAGLPNVDGNLFNKPVGSDTPTFKVDILTTLRAQGRPVEAFITESRTDLARILRMALAPRAVRLEWPNEPASTSMPAGQPVIRYKSLRN